jgi:hypothetical protein
MTDQPYVLADLETGAAHAFSRRHIGVTQDDVATMLHDWPRLLRHPHAGCAQAQHPGEPGLVHRLHAVPAGDQPGPLEALLNFQTMIADLTGLEVANASMLDEATAAAEAMTLLRRAGKSKRRVLVVDVDLFPQTIAVIDTRAEPLGIEVVVAALDPAACPTGLPRASSSA